MQFLQGLAGIIIAFLFVVYRRKLYELTGPMEFIENLGFFDTVTFYALLGLGIFILSLMWMFGTLQALFFSTLGGIFGVN